MRRRSVRTRRESEGGYALLMVFLMAAIIALMLYQQLPRVAFESERDKEQLLIDRGEQYVRAIQLYYVANNRQYPTSIDDLEKREKRFLRRRYKDPYTGKDEWRIIHTNGGFLTDSLVQKPPAAGDSQSQSASNSPGSTTGNTTAADQQPQINAAVLQRPSDRPRTPPGGFAQPFAQNPNGQPNTSQSSLQNNAPLPPITLQPQQGPGALPPITLQPGGITQPGGLPPITLVPTGTQGGQQGTPPNPGQNPGQPGQLRPPQLVPGQNPVSPFPGQPSPGGLPGGIQTGVPPGFRIDPSGQLVPAPPVPGQTPGQGQPFSPQTGQPQFPSQQTIQNQQFQQFQNQQLQNQPGGTPGSPNAALNLINQLLTSPRQTPSTPIATGGNQIGGIAGVASTYTGPSIKVYKDQDQYQLWEFVFSPTASTVPGAGVGAGGIVPGRPGGAPGGTGGANPGGGLPGGGQPGIFGPGGTGGFGQGGGRGGPGGQPGGIFQTTPPGR
jgi:hypothetical protein